MRYGAGKVPFHEEDVPELLERNRDRLAFTLDAGEVAEGADFLFVCVDTPPTYSGDADLSRVWTVVDELPRLEERTVLVMKSTVPVGTGEKVRVGLDARGLTNVGYVSNPEFLAEGRAVARLHEPRPDRDRRLRGGRRRRCRGPVRRSRLHRRALRRELGRDDQARRERVPDDADQLHQRDRQRLRADGRRRHEGRRGRRPRSPPRAAFPSGWDRLRRLLLPEGLARAQAACVELRLPLPAARGRDRGERAAEAARDREAPEAPRPPAREARRPARPGLQAAHRRHARGAEHRARLAPAGRRGRGHGLGSCRQAERAAPRRRPCARARSRRCAEPTRR